VTANEITDLKDKLSRLAEAAEKTIDIDGLIELASKAPSLEEEAYIPPIRIEGKPHIAVAYDNAFCFYYKDTFRLFEALGAELAFFSPLDDNNLPENISGLYLGGGYPELYAERLSQNK
jgi:cobyrinic acid a,c-diamide synthase